MKKWKIVWKFSGNIAERVKKQKISKNFRAVCVRLCSSRLRANVVEFVKSLDEKTRFVRWPDRSATTAWNFRNAFRTGCARSGVAGNGNWFFYGEPEPRSCVFSEENQFKCVFRPRQSERWKRSWTRRAATCKHTAPRNRRGAHLRAVSVSRVRVQTHWRRAGMYVRKTNNAEIWIGNVPLRKEKKLLSRNRTNRHSSKIHCWSTNRLQWLGITCLAHIV